MKAINVIRAAVLTSTFAMGSAWADATYQVTGPILSVTDTTVVIQKGAEKWEIAKDQATAVKGGELKVGAKATVKYRMTAASIEVKEEKAKK